MELIGGLALSFIGLVGIMLAGAVYYTQEFFRRWRRWPLWALYATLVSASAPFIVSWWIGYTSYYGAQNVFRAAIQRYERGDCVLFLFADAPREMWQMALLTLVLTAMTYESALQWWKPTDHQPAMSY